MSPPTSFLIRDYFSDCFLAIASNTTILSSIAKNLPLHCCVKQLSSSRNVQMCALIGLSSYYCTDPPKQEECWGRNKVAEIVGILEHTAVSLRSATAHPSAAHTPVDKPATTSQSYQYKPANSSGSEYAWPAAPCSTQQSFQPGSAPVNIANSSMPQQPAHMAPQFQPSRFMVDPQQPFTFLPGSDFAAPGPSQGPLSFDPYLPSLAADQSECSYRSVPMLLGK